MTGQAGTGTFCPYPVQFRLLEYPRSEQAMSHSSLAVSDPTDGPLEPMAEHAAMRRILCVFPRYEPSLGSFDYAYDITGNLRAFMPPQGLLVIAASVPPGWQVRFVDENIGAPTHEDFAWADAVFVSGMHVQRHRIIDIC